MSIGAVSSVNPLLAQLHTQGLAANQANLVESDISAVTGGSSTDATPTPITPAMRAAIDTKIASDVLSGKLSASDAAAVQKTLDGLGGQTSDSDTDADATNGTATTTPPAGGTTGTGKAHHGGGGGKAAPTEVSESVTVDGSTETTVITYSDNTTSTVTTTASDSDIAKYAKPAAGGNVNGAAKDYTQTIEPGLLIDQVA